MNRKFKNSRIKSVIGMQFVKSLFFVKSII